MVDIFTKEQRSLLMSKIREADTKPEWILRCGLHKLGFRYRLNNRNLPGKPDLVFPKYHTALFIHGCFWHHHSNCKNATIPKKNQDFWVKKLEENTQRDTKVVERLRNLNWKVIIVWECELEGNTIETIERIARELKTNCDGYYASGQNIILDRKIILTRSQQRVRKRIDSYKKGE